MDKHSNNRAKLPYGLGAVTERAAGFEARLRRQPDGKRPVLGVFPTYDEAVAELWRVVKLAKGAKLEGGSVMTLRAYGPRFLDAREIEGRGKAMKGQRAPRTIQSDRSRWRLHVETATFADWPPDAIDAKDIREHLAAIGKKTAADVRAADPKKRKKNPRRAARKLSGGTTRHVFNLLSKAFDAMKADGFCRSNPCDGVARPKVQEATFAFLTLDDQRKIEACAWRPKRAGDDAELRGEADKLRAMFAWGTGLRQDDQWGLKLADVRGLETGTPHLYYYNHKKQGMVRCPLFGVALRATLRQIAILPRYAAKNEHRLLFPLPSGARRQPSKNYGWHKLRAFAGVETYVTWHELRDTCATSLLNGWWGPAWRLEDVRDMLAHSGIEVTERYAHLDPGRLGELARTTAGAPREIGHGIGHGIVADVSGEAKSSTNTERATPDSNRGPSAPEAKGIGSESAGLSGLRGQFVANLAKSVLAAGAVGDRRFARLATELAEAVLEALAASEAQANVIPLLKRAR